MKSRFPAKSGASFFRICNGGLTIRFGTGRAGMAKIQHPSFRHGPSCRPGAVRSPAEAPGVPDGTLQLKHPRFALAGSQ